MHVNYSIWTSVCTKYLHLLFARRYIFYIGGWINNVGQSSLFFMDLLTKLRWVLQAGKINPPGLVGQVLSNHVLEESIKKFLIYILQIVLSILELNKTFIALSVYTFFAKPIPAILHLRIPPGI